MRLHRGRHPRSLAATAAILLTLLLAGSVGAQESSGGATLPVAIPLRLLDSLSLTTEQRTAIEADLADRKVTLDDILDRIRASGTPSESDRLELRNFIEARNAAIRAALTEQQLILLESLLART